MKLIFLGPPGAGKGTQAEEISKRFEIAHISTGDMLRHEIYEKSALGICAKGYIDNGELVPDDVIISMVKKRITFEDCENGFLLDGFPRNIAQAEALCTFSDIDMVIDISVPSERLVERIGGRRLCGKCGAGYHTSTYPLPNCKRCGEPLIIREDDKPETVLHRIGVYHLKTEPLIDYYKSRGLICVIDGDKAPGEVLLDIIKSLEKMHEQ